VMVLPADTESALAGTATWTTKHKKGTPPDDQVSPRPPHRRGRCQKRTREQGGGHLRGVRRSDMRGELGDAARGDHLMTARVEERGEVWLSQKQKSRGDSKNEKSCALHAAAAAAAAQKTNRSPKVKSIESTFSVLLHYFIILIHVSRRRRRHKLGSSVRFCLP